METFKLPLRISSIERPADPGHKSDREHWGRWYYVSVTYGIRWKRDIHHYMISRDMFR